MKAFILIISTLAGGSAFWLAKVTLHEWLQATSGSSRARWCSIQTLNAGWLFLLALSIFICASYMLSAINWS